MGHSKRVCRIWKSEVWRQIRFLQDCLRAKCFEVDTGWYAHHKLKRYHRVIAQTTEFRWRCTLNFSPKKPRRVPADPAELHLPDNVELPERISSLLKKGTKFSVPPNLRVHELLATNRRIAKCAPGEDGERCLLDGVDVLLKNVQRTHLHPKDPTKAVVTHFRRNHLQLMQADKEGGFVVLTAKAFGEKAIQALQKNFVPTTSQASKVKAKAILLCKDLELLKISKAISTSRQATLSVFFSAETHNVDMSFTCIVSEHPSVHCQEGSSSPLNTLGKY